MSEIFYRYEDVLYAPMLDEFEYPIGESRLAVELRQFKVIKHTKCGVWIDIDRFVNTERVKQYAHKTKELAKESFIARKQKQARIYEKKAMNARLAINLVDYC